MTNFSQRMADQNKLQELKTALEKSKQDYPKIAPIAAEAGYPMQNTKAQQIAAQIKALEAKIAAANDTF
jgi:UDP-N-acetyl-D-mannosaminuronic acid transferase (WecB/TagA/CpsF family)